VGLLGLAFAAITMYGVYEQRLATEWPAWFGFLQRSAFFQRIGTSSHFNVAFLWESGNMNAFTNVTSRSARQFHSFRSIIFSFLMTWTAECCLIDRNH
jgi:hypothetical protein